MWYLITAFQNYSTTTRKIFMGYGSGNCPSNNFYPEYNLKTNEGSHKDGGHSAQEPAGSIRQGMAMLTINNLFCRYFSNHVRRQNSVVSQYKSQQTCMITFIRHRLPIMFFQNMAIRHVLYVDTYRHNILYMYIYSHFSAKVSTWWLSIICCRSSSIQTFFFKIVTSDLQNKLFHLWLANTNVNVVIMCKTNFFFI